MQHCQASSVSRGLRNTLDRIVQAYFDNNAQEGERYLRFYAIQRSLEDAVTKAAMAELPNGQRFIHQHRIPAAVLGQARDALLKLDYRSLTSFAELHELVAKTLHPIHGVGLLTIYDTAHRLGAYFKLSPEHVYLHAGVRVGAKALGLQDWKDKLTMNVFPQAFQRLRPEQAEDCLCIYKRELEIWRRSKSGVRYRIRKQRFSTIAEDPKKGPTL
jgi:hypothetical protein